MDARILRVFKEDTMVGRLMGALARHEAINVKEIAESLEFFERTRKRLRRRCVVDLCAGHGLTGMIFGLLERRVEEVILVDMRRPDSFDVILKALCEVGPWLADKVRYVESRIQHVADQVPEDAALLAIHACGMRTDHCIDMAIERRAPIGLMPCCYTARSLSSAPPGLRDGVGLATACDVHRTYRLDAAGFDVRWTSVPEAITPMNRVLVACPR